MGRYKRKSGDLIIRPHVHDVACDHVLLDPFLPAADLRRSCLKDFDIGRRPECNGWDVDICVRVRERPDTWVGSQRFVVMARVKPDTIFRKQCVTLIVALW